MGNKLTEYEFREAVGSAGNWCMGVYDEMQEMHIEDLLELTNLSIFEKAKIDPKIEDLFNDYKSGRLNLEECQEGYIHRCVHQRIWRDSFVAYAYMDFSFAALFLSSKECDIRESKGRGYLILSQNGDIVTVATLFFDRIPGYQEQIAVSPKMFQNWGVSKEQVLNCIARNSSRAESPLEQ